MIYFKDEDLIIRDMEEADAQAFYDGFLAQGWHPDMSVYELRLKDRAEGRCVALTAVYRGDPAGSVYVYLTPHGGPFEGKGWPEIHDFNVLKKYQRKGIGNRLMEAAEQVAAQYADTVWLGVGLCDSYGSAQRMYIKRGFIPDGSGVWYRNQQCVQYETVCTVDDDLVLFLSKKLPGAHPSEAKNETGNPGQATAEDMRRIFFISGPCGSGKSTFADAWAKHLVRQENRTVYVIHGDDFHAGFTEPEEKPAFFVDGQASDRVLWEDILRFNWDCILFTAGRALDQGLDVVIDYVIEDELPRVKELAAEHRAALYYIVLTAEADELERRIRERGDTDLAERALFLKKKLEAMPENLGHLYNNTGKTVDDMVREILPGQFEVGI